VKDKLVKLWNWKGIDYLIQLAIIAAFVFGNVKIMNAHDTLQNEGCEAYWQEYNPEVNLSEVELVNSTEAAYLKEGRIPPQSLQTVNRSLQEPG